MPTLLDSESKSIIENTLLRFVEESYDPTARRARLGQSPVDYRLHWPTFAKLGVLGVPFEESFGGLGGCAVDTADVIRVLAKGLILEPFVESAVIAGNVLAAGDQTRSEAAVAELIGGERAAVMVGGRAGRPDQLHFDKMADGYRLTGQARVVPYAANADDWLIAAMGIDGAPSIFYVPRSEAGAILQNFRLMDGRSASDVSFSAAVIPASSLWLEGAAAVAALERANLHAASAYCADAVGCMAQLLEITGAYLKTRVQFGVAIGSFQALQHRFADMHMVYLEARAISRSLAASLDGGSTEEQRWRCFSAFSVVTAAGAKVGHESIQMHGGMGVTDELIVSHYNARLVTFARLLRSVVSHDVTPPALMTARNWI